MNLNFHRTGSGPPLVLIHGIGHSWHGFEPVLDLLAGDRDVIALDLPGFGASPPPPPGTPPGAPSLARLVSAFLDTLDLERPHVAGNSLGGWVALELAKAGRAASVTGLSPAGFHNSAEAAWQRSTLWLGFNLARSLRRRPELLTANPRRRRIATAQYVAKPLTQAQASDIFTGAAGSTWFVETLKAITREPFTGGEQIDVPVTIAWADHDYVLLPRQAPRAARAIPGARSITLTGCGHLAPYDDPEQVTRVLLEGSGG